MPCVLLFLHLVAGPIGLCAMLSAKAFGAAAVCVTGKFSHVSWKG